MDVERDHGLVGLKSQYSLFEMNCGTQHGNTVEVAQNRKEQRKAKGKQYRYMQSL